MISSFRRSARSWTAAAILLFVLIAIVITGFGTGGMGGLGHLRDGGNSPTTLASVGGRSLDESDFSDVLNRQYASSREQRPELDMATFVNEAFEPILSQMITGLAVQDFGEAQGLIVSPRMIDAEIVKIPAFHDLAGRFDENIFRGALRARNVNEGQLRDDIARSLMSQQLLGPVARGAFVPQGVARAYADLLLERRRGEIGVVPVQLTQQGIAPTDAEVATYYQRNRARFAVPEQRVIRYAMIGADQVAAAVHATDPEIAQYYRQHAADYGPRETRTLLSIVLPDQAAAQRFAGQVRGGTDFVAAAGTAGFSAQDITAANQNRAQFAGRTSPEVAAAAFAAADGAVIGPIRSPLGFHVVKVQHIEFTPARTLDSVRAEIVHAIEQRKQAEALEALVGRIEDRIGDGASLEQAAQSEHLTVNTTPPVTSTGQIPGHPELNLPPDVHALLQGAFELDPDDSEPEVATVQANQRYALIGLERVIPAAPPPLAQIHDQVRAALIQSLALARARNLAQQIVDRINHGTPAAQAFAQVRPGLPAPRPIDFVRSQINRGGEVPPPILTLFSLPEGRAQIMAAPNDAGWFVIHHSQRTPGNAGGQPQLVATTRTQFTQVAPQEAAEQFAASIETATGVRRNDAAIRAARDRLTGAAAPQ